MREPCGCEPLQSGFSAPGVPDFAIVFCPLHAAAPDLLAALERAAYRIPVDEYQGLEPGWREDALQIHAALAKLGGAN